MNEVKMTYAEYEAVRLAVDAENELESLLECARKSRFQNTLKRLNTMTPEQIAAAYLGKELVRIAFVPEYKEIDGADALLALYEGKDVYFTDEESTEFCELVSVRHSVNFFRQPDRKFYVKESR